jgi:RNA polymerase sigma factor (sigma-70 family)
MNTAEEDPRMSDVTTITDLVTAAARGDEGAWDLIVKRYLPLVYSVMRSFRLSRSDAQDVNQAVWLRLVEHLDDIRDPRALPGWIAVTTRHEALHLLGSRKRTVLIDPMSSQVFDDQPLSAPTDEDLLRSERRQVLREALAELPQKQRELLLLLVADPPVSYTEISKRLGIPVGSIGPTRARCLERLRATSTLKAFLASDADINQFGG